MQANESLCLVDCNSSDDTKEELPAKPILINGEVNGEQKSSEEIERKNKFIGDFDMKNSEAYKAVERYCGKPKRTVLCKLVMYVVCEEAAHGNYLKMDRQVQRDRTALYKFINDNLAIFIEYFKAGTRIGPTVEK